MEGYTILDEETFKAALEDTDSSYVLLFWDFDGNPMGEKPLRSITYSDLEANTWFGKNENISIIEVVDSNGEVVERFKRFIGGFTKVLGRRFY